MGGDSPAEKEDKPAIDSLFAGYAALAIPSNIVISYMGARTWLPIITLLWGCVAACNAAATDAASFCALRFLLGAAEAGNFPGIMVCRIEPRSNLVQCCSASSMLTSVQNTCRLLVSLHTLPERPPLSFAYAVILSSAVLSQVLTTPSRLPGNLAPSALQVVTKVLCKSRK